VHGGADDQGGNVLFAVICLAFFFPERLVLSHNAMNGYALYMSAG
jgi:hypothetical protein